MKCTKCNAELPDGKTFCHMCGAKQETNSPKYCIKCGNALPNGAAFCNVCGAPQNSQGTAQAPQQPVMQQPVQPQPVRSTAPAPAAGSAVQNMEYSSKNKVIHDLLGFFFGYFGVHNFYRGSILGGIAYILYSFVIPYASLVICGILEIKDSDAVLFTVLSILIFFYNFAIGLELLTVKVDNSKKRMTGSAVPGTILGSIMVLFSIGTLINMIRFLAIR